MYDKNVYSVRQVNAYIKNIFTQDYMMSRICVRGEVSNCKYHPSGHIYFSLKDESGTIACVMFAGARSGLSFRIREGQQVLVSGNVSVYERDGRYQLYAREIRLDGAGLLNERFEQLKRELEEMGMFAQEYKRALPFYPSSIGIVTASSGAAVRDIIQIARRRNPYIQLILYPAQVQGKSAAESIVRGIRMLEKKQVDLIIVGRGGGSIEDLWAFNEEVVARAIFDCSVPVISAVGHETDTTISDYVADLRAPTPSAAAELAVPEFAKLQSYKGELRERLRRQMELRITLLRGRLEHSRLRLNYRHPRQQLQEKRQYLVEMEDRLRKEMNEHLRERRYRLGILLERMKGLSPLSRLNGGFAYVEGTDGHRISSVTQIKKGDEILVYMKDGRIWAEIKKSTKEIGYERRTEQAD